MDFLTQYLVATGGTMVPERYNLWSGVFLLAAATGRKVFIDYAHFLVRPNLYITLVGDQGMRKGTAKDLAMRMFTRVFPDYPLGDSRMSDSVIVKFMASDACLRTYQDETGKPIEWHPAVFFINELKNFMAYDPRKMVDFLTDIYDRDIFTQNTRQYGKEIILNPCLNLLACETPDWIIDKLKTHVTSGGFSRRNLMVYELIAPPRITFPIKTAEAYAAERWCMEHLLRVEKCVGPLSWAPDAKEYFDTWNRALIAPSDTVLKGLYEAKDILAAKIATLITLAIEPIKLELTLPIVQTAIRMLEDLEVNLPKLTVAVGRNELAVPQARLMQLLADNGGKMQEKLFHLEASRNMSEGEYLETMRLLKSTDQITEATQEGKLMVLTRDLYNSYKMAEKLLAEAPKKIVQ